MPLDRSTFLFLAASLAAGCDGGAGTGAGDTDVSEDSGDTSDTSDTEDTGLDCLGDEGTPDCGSLPDTCDEWQVGICESAGDLYKAGVVQGIVECLTDSQCGDPNAYGCTEQAALAACPDEEADTVCDTIVDACPSADYAECQQWLSGMTPNGRQAMADCMTPEQFCDYGFYTCSEGLSF